MKAISTSALWTVVVMLTFVLATCCVSWGETGVTDNEIIVGQSCALSGSAQALGQGMKAGLSAYFEKINASGGINGRKIRLISEDDGYEPDKAIEKTRKLIEKDNVFVLIGEVGTPTCKAIMPIIEETKTPLVGPFTGAEILRSPFNKYIVNVRASYNQEMEKLATYLVDQKGLKKVACFYQNDAYGKAGLSGIEIALKKRSLALCATGTYERGSTAVKNGLLDIRKGEPETVVMVGTYKACAEFIKLAKELEMTDVIFCNISFVGTEALQKELGAVGEGCIISQVVNVPSDESIPLVKEFQESMKKYQPEASAGFVSLEGFMAGKLFCMVVEKAGPDLSREKFLATLAEVKAFDLGGITLTYGPEDHQGMDQVFLTQIKDGKIQSF